MKKVFVLVLTLAVFCSIYSQEFSGTVTYKVMITQEYDSEYKPTDALAKKVKERNLSSLAKQVFLLEFDNSKSKFVRNNILSIDVSKEEQLYDKMANSYSSTYNYYLDNILKLGMFYYINNGMLVKQNVKDKDWSISTESKKIGDYLCYKAVYLKSYMNSKGKNITIPITAWFAPELPYRYGPKEYYGLPGLILELHERYSVFLATEVKIDEG
ncbi:MAG TPA: GLPGLI family protein, partial [Flavobacterium sp.]|nr:GLPGLI family protein [Flavobacterium sp.]